MTNKSSLSTALRIALQGNTIVQLLEILLVFFVAFFIIVIAQPFIGDNPLVRQGVVWGANIVMLFLVWLGLRFRGQSWSHLGLRRKFISLRTFLLSLLVLIAAMIGFITGSIIMANITGIPESADMSGYNFLQGNFPMLLAILPAVFLVSSFGEEVIYRGFLITRVSEMGGSGKIAVRIAVGVSAIIFGLVHYEWGLVGIVQTAFMGLVLGISFLLLKRNLWTLIFAHAYMDAILMIQMYVGGGF